MVDSEPVIINESLKKKVWVNSIKEELEAIEINKTCELTFLTQNKKAISVRKVFKIKPKPDSSISKHKARLIARGFIQKYGLYYFEMFAPVARHETIRLVIVIAANRNWPLIHLDVKSSFLNGSCTSKINKLTKSYTSEINKFNKVLMNAFDITDLENMLKCELELLKRFELMNCKPTITHAEANHNLDSDVNGEGVDAITLKQLVGCLRYMCNTIPNICYTVGMVVWLINLLHERKFKVSKPVRLMIDNKYAISVTKNLVFHGKKKAH
ncbi:uncharacterized protein LOC127136281 [Lathyrus oleraceus]|uniref:uncharacterized protein LOC127136281 n=1 Tax=Pisum sativum TaxID=3888 RepID=UPI0021CF274C|nr:uncharacterized protein LOC127136281 [Pisum sativum]